MMRSGYRTEGRPSRWAAFGKPLDRVSSFQLGGMTVSLILFNTIPIALDRHSSLLIAVGGETLDTSLRRYVEGVAAMALGCRAHRVFHLPRWGA